MAFTYKIKPLEWTEKKGYKDSRFFQSCYGCFVNPDGDFWYGDYSRNESDLFKTAKEAMEWVEERHIENLKQYLEEV